MIKAVVFISMLCRLSLADYDHNSDGSLTVTLNHSFDGKNFSPRGNILIKNLRTNNYVANQVPLGPEELNSIKRNYEDGVYLVEATVKVDGEEQGPFRTFLPMCLLHESDLMDRLTIHFSPSQVIGVTIHGEASVCNGYHEKSLSGFRTRVGYTFAEAGIQPDTSSFVQRIEQEKTAKQQGETTDNRGFFAKYWMYIVPVVIFLLISGSGQETQGSGR